MNEFFKTITAILSILAIFALFTWKPIDVAWSVYDKYEDLELAFYGLMFALLAYILIIGIIFSIGYGIVTLVEKIHEKANQ